MSEKGLERLKKKSKSRTLPSLKSNNSVVKMSTKKGLNANEEHSKLLCGQCDLSSLYPEHG